MSETKATIRLLQNAQAGDQQALDQLFSQYHQLAESIARKYQRKQYEYEDLQQIAYYGLCCAIRDFDTSRQDVSFSSYLYATVNGVLLNHAAVSHHIHIPRRMYSVWETLLEEQSRVLREEDRFPTLVECANNIGIPSSLAHAVTMGYSDVLSLDDQLCEGEDQTCEPDAPTFGDLIVDPESLDAIENINLRLCIDAAMSTLPARLQRILQMRYFDGLSLSEVGKRMGLTHQRINQLEKDALRMMKKNLAGRI